jgi:hypothetical protein
LNGGDWLIIYEFTEVESGKRSDRPERDKALAAARLRKIAAQRDRRRSKAAAQNLVRTRTKEK